MHSVLSARRTRARGLPVAYPQDEDTVRLSTKTKVAVPRLQQISFTLRVRVSHPESTHFFLICLRIDIPLIAGNIRFTSPAEFTIKNSLISVCVSRAARSRARPRPRRAARDHILYLYHPTRWRCQPRHRAAIVRMSLATMTVQSRLATGYLSSSMPSCVPQRSTRHSSGGERRET